VAQVRDVAVVLLLQGLQEVVVRELRLLELELQRAAVALELDLVEAVVVLAQLERGLPARLPPRDLVLVLVEQVLTGRRRGKRARSRRI